MVVLTEPEMSEKLLTTGLTKNIAAAICLGIVVAAGIAWMTERYLPHIAKIQENP